jgi:hypothetical protein
MKIAKTLFHASVIAPISSLSGAFGAREWRFEPNDDVFAEPSGRPDRLRE